jgi:DNA transformation protein
MDADAIHDLFSAFRAVTVRRMFGGAGIYADGVMFALLADGALYLKAGEANAPDFDRENLEPFTYTAKTGKRAVMSYRRMPERLYDDPDELADWAARALQVAQRARGIKLQPRTRPRASARLKRKRKGGKNTAGGKP